MITFDDMVKVIFDRTRFNLSAFNTALPGGQWTGRGPPGDPDGYPYAVMQIESGAVKNSTGGLYTQLWTARLAAYAPMGDAATSIQGVLQMWNTSLLSTAGNTALRGAALRNATEKILRAHLAPGKGEYAKELREGRDVFLAGLSLELLVQGDKDVA